MGRGWSAARLGLSAMMMFAGLAASAAVDLLSLLQPEKPKGGTGVAAQSSFKIPDLGSVEAASTQSQAASAGQRSEGLSADALGTLLSAQSQTQPVQNKKRSISVLLDLLQSSQDGSVKKSDFDDAIGESDGKASEIFDRIDENHDNAINVAELTSFLDTYRRNSEVGATGRSRTLAVVA
jgi:hypothetical protein